MALKVIAGGGAAALTMGVGYGLVERRASTFDDAPDLGAQAWLARLGTSLPDEKDSRPGIEGEIPAGLRGTLYRNGPGLFDRDGDRKPHLLDGDGMIRCWDFSDQDVRFRTSFVKTRKYKAEEAAGRFLYPTWTSLTGKWGNSLGGNFPSQAGVTPVIYDGKLLAFDEIGLPWELDPHTLETIGEYPVADDHQIRTFKAHTKTDAKTGDLILLGSNSGRKTTLHVVIRGKDGALKSHFEHESPRASYFHDFFATENYVIAHLQPFELPTIPVAFLAGVRSFTDSLTYDRSRGTILIVMPKDGSAPRIVEAPGCFMWHTLNAYERGDEIIADFVGFDDPGHAFGERAIFKTLMRGKAGESGAPGTLRRYVLDPAASTAREEVIADGQFEFPIVNWTLSG